MNKLNAKSVEINSKQECDSKDKMEEGKEDSKRVAIRRSRTPMPAGAARQTEKSKESEPSRTANG